MERIDIWGSSILHPPTDFIPEGLTPEEEKWLTAALALDFEGRGIVLEQLSRSRVRKDRNAESVLITFEGESNTPKAEFPFSPILSLTAYRQAGSCVPCDLNSFRGRIDSMYIYMPDGSDLALSDIPLDDVEYEMPAYAMQATHEMENLFQQCKPKHLRDFATSLAERAQDRKNAILRAMDEIGASVDGFVGDGLGPLCASIRIDLGVTEQGSYEAVAQISFVGDYFVSYPVLNGVESPYPSYGGTLKHFKNYPNGQKLGELRRKCYEYGFKPLTYSMVHHGMATLTSKRKRQRMERSRIFGALGGNSRRRLLDCYFTGDGLA